MAAAIVVVMTMATAASQREVVNFDFAWRHFLGDPTGHSRLANCTSGTQGINYGIGGNIIRGVPSPKDCCAHCSQASWCGCWDWNTMTQDCWIKSNCSFSVPNNERVSALLPRLPPLPGSPEPARTNFDDSKWEIVDLPHDMLVVQKYDKNADMKHAFLDRNFGWYRKHFKLPSDWQGHTIWLSIEGAFHETTAWLNGQQVAGTHVAGYTGFQLRLDNMTNVYFGDDKENILAIHVNATSGTGWWYEGGGMNRHVELIRTSPLHFEPDGVWIRSNPDLDSTAINSANFTVSTTVVNNFAKAECFRVVVSMPSGFSVQGVWTDISGGASITTPDMSWKVANVKLWSVQEPNLLNIAVSLQTGSGDCSNNPVFENVVDQVDITHGVRHIRFDSNSGLFLNGENIKLRGFCDHSSFAGVGVAVADRINLFRAQTIRSVGGNAWRMAHNPPTRARLDFMDRLGMLCDDENRDYGGHRGQGGQTDETVSQELVDMRDLIKRDRNHASVLMWSFCNEVGCNNETSAQAFRAVSKEWDWTRPVTQNHHGTDLSTQYLDVQGFSHKNSKDFVDFHKKYPKKPMVASECCSCMSQRGVDQDVCPHPKDGGCTDGPQVPPGVFYNNNIGQCTAEQVMRSDSLAYVAGTFVWSGFDYMGEARGWPQNTKCRGTIADVAGFRKETAYWLRSWWLSNISKADPGRPKNVDDLFVDPHEVRSGDHEKWTIFIVETWAPSPTNGNRTINIYTNAPMVRLLRNGEKVGETSVPFFGMATFSVEYKPGNITAQALGPDGKVEAAFTSFTPGEVASVVLSLDAPSVHTGTGTNVVLDGEDVALIRATLLDANGRIVPLNNNISFTVTGPGRIWATHNGDPANLSPGPTHWNQAYKGLARVIIRTTIDAASPASHRRRLLAIDVDSGYRTSILDPDMPVPHVDPIHVTANVVDSSGHIVVSDMISIPTSSNLKDLPFEVATRVSDLSH